MDMIVCETDRLYHYLLGGDEALPSILERGLLPLSAMPEHPRWQRSERALPAFYRQLYAQWAEPVLRRPYRHSGIFLTPIDFRRLPDLLLATRTRIVLPLSALDCQAATVTYEIDERRIVLPLTVENLEETARRWPADMVRAWFGRDRTKLFYFVPQVAVYQESGQGAIPVRPEWVEREIARQR